jgi:flavin-dependent dehydrogenase
MHTTCDVAIIGGGPGGSTTGALLKKYEPGLSVHIIEREIFPREHIGESQLPQIGSILDELGIWDQVERAGFPVKVGATFKWGQRGELWDFNLVPPDSYVNQPRPGTYAGVRRDTAFQVDRATYDNILLRNAEKLGCIVREGVGVRSIDHADDTVSSLTLTDGSRVEAKHYVDASGHAGILRRAMGVEIDCPTLLKNIAIWDYWTNTAWADTIGSGGTRVQVISVGFGWLWFIPISPTRTSLGLVCPASYYKQAGKPPEQLYSEALALSDRITGFLQGATRENVVRTTNDWSFVSSRVYGNNWYLVGECAGFADPILSAGMTLAHVGGRELAYTLRALHRKEHDRHWLLNHYQDNQQKRVRQHMRFAEFWYTANSLFTDLREHCSDIAKQSGLSLSPHQAWTWLAQGGFTNDVVGQAGIGGLDFTGVNQVAQRFLDSDLPWNADGKNLFTLKLDGATKSTLPNYHEGRIVTVQCYERDGKRLAITGMTQLLILALEKLNDIAGIIDAMLGILRDKMDAAYHPLALKQAMQVLEVLVTDGWVEASLNPMLPMLNVGSPREGVMVQTRQKEWTSGTRT